MTCWSDLEFRKWNIHHLRTRSCWREGGWVWCLSKFSFLGVCLYLFIYIRHTPHIFLQVRSCRITPLNRFSLFTKSTISLIWLNNLIMSVFYFHFQLFGHIYFAARDSINFPGRFSNLSYAAVSIVCISCRLQLNIILLLCHQHVTRGEVKAVPLSSLIFKDEGFTK